MNSNFDKASRFFNFVGAILSPLVLPALMFAMATASAGCGSGEDILTPTPIIEVEESLTPVEDIDGDGWTTGEGDCDDNSPHAYPGKTEVCDGIDNNCDGKIDEGLQRPLYLDEDGDDYGVGDPIKKGCPSDDGYSEDGGDCDDSDFDTNPDAEEQICDGIDNNCDGDVDDMDGDGSMPIECGGQDCDDTNPDVEPNDEEVVDGIDNNCDGKIDEGDTVENPFIAIGDSYTFGDNGDTGGFRNDYDYTCDGTKAWGPDVVYKMPALSFPVTLWVALYITDDTSYLQVLSVHTSTGICKTVTGEYDDYFEYAVEIPAGVDVYITVDGETEGSSGEYLFGYAYYEL